MIGQANSVLTVSGRHGVDGRGGVGAGRAGTIGSAAGSIVNWEAHHM